MVSPNDNTTESKLKPETKAKTAKAETKAIKAMEENTTNVANIKDNIIEEVEVNKLIK